MSPRERERDGQSEKEGGGVFLFGRGEEREERVYLRCSDFLLICYMSQLQALWIILECFCSIKAPFWSALTWGVCRYFSDLVNGHLRLFSFFINNIHSYTLVESTRV